MSTDEYRTRDTDGDVLTEFAVGDAVRVEYDPPNGSRQSAEGVVEEIRPTSDQDYHGGRALVVLSTGWRFYPPDGSIRKDRRRGRVKRVKTLFD